MLVVCAQCWRDTPEPLSVKTSATRIRGPFCPECANKIAQKDVINRQSTGTHKADFRHGSDIYPDIGKNPYSEMFRRMQKRGQIRPWRE